MKNLLTALHDLRRPACWEHLGVPDPDEPKRWIPWTTRSMSRPWPWLGGDEWCRWTLVLPMPLPGLIGQLIIPLWTCHDPHCETCLLACRPLTAPRNDTVPADKDSLGTA
jgi:hypothetical protein